jgi:hypothetical protein
MYTLFLRYTIDPNKLSDWRAYAQAEFEPSQRVVAASRDTTAPTEFAGATSEAFATIDVGTMAEYEGIARSLPRTPSIRKMSARSRRPARSTPYIAPSFSGSSQE